MPAVSFVSLLPLGDTTIRHELLGLFLLFEDLKGIRSKPDGSTPQIANSEVWSSSMLSGSVPDKPLESTQQCLLYSPWRGQSKTSL